MRNGIRHEKTREIVLAYGLVPGTVAAGLTAATATHEYEQKGSTFVTRSQRGENGEWTSNDFVADGSVVTGNDDVRTSLTFSLRLSRNLLSLLLPLRVKKFKVASRVTPLILS